MALPLGPERTAPGLPNELDEPDGAQVMVGDGWPGMSWTETFGVPSAANPSPPTNTWIFESVEPELPETDVAPINWPFMVGTPALTIGFREFRFDTFEYPGVRW